MPSFTYQAQRPAKRKRGAGEVTPMTQEAIKATSGQQSIQADKFRNLVDEIMYSDLQITESIKFTVRVRVRVRAIIKKRHSFFIFPKDQAYKEIQDQSELYLSRMFKAGLEMAMTDPRQKRQTVFPKVRKEPPSLKKTQLFCH